MATNRRNLKIFIRVDGSGRDVAGSSVWRKSMPKNGKWRELQGYECCNPTTTTTTTFDERN